MTLDLIFAQTLIQQLTSFIFYFFLELWCTTIRFMSKGLYFTLVRKMEKEHLICNGPKPNSLKFYIRIEFLTLHIEFFDGLSPGVPP